MTLTAIETLLLAAAPSLTAILGILVATATIIAKFSTLIKDVRNNTANAELRHDLEVALKDNAELKKVAKRLTEQLSRVKYEDIHDE